MADTLVPADAAALAATTKPARAPLPVERFHIGAFRGLKDLTFEGCRRINILLGTNNSGKTSVLEALAIAGSAPSLHAYILAMGFRRDQGLSSIGRVDKIIKS